jgi:hypothetical protein
VDARAGGLTGMIRFDRHLHDVVEGQTVEPERIAFNNAHDNFS